MTSSNQMQGILREAMEAVPAGDVLDALERHGIAPRTGKWKMEVPDARIKVEAWVVADFGYWLIVHRDGDRPWGLQPAPAAMLNDARWFATLEEAAQEALSSGL